MKMTPGVVRNRAEASKRAALNTKRRQAVRDALAGEYTPSTPEVGAAAARNASRHALALARASFDSAIGDNAEKLAGHMVELALEGDVSCLLTVARSIVPPAKYDSTKIRLDVGAIETLADVDAARRRVAEAVFAAEVGVEDGSALAKMLDSIASGIEREQRTALLTDMRTSLAATARSGVGARVAMMTTRVELILNGGTLDGDEPTVIEGTAELDADDWQAFL